MPNGSAIYSLAGPRTRMRRNHAAPSGPCNMAAGSSIAGHAQAKKGQIAGSAGFTQPVSHRPMTAFSVGCSTMAAASPAMAAICCLYPMQGSGFLPSATAPMLGHPRRYGTQRPRCGRRASSSGESWTYRRCWQMAMLRPRQSGPMAAYLVSNCDWR